MRILRQTALLAGSFVILTVVASQAPGQEGLQPVASEPGQLQAVPEPSAEASAPAAEASDAFTYDNPGGCNCGTPALIGASSGCTCACPQGPLASLGRAAHSGQPLIDPWMRADWIAAQQAMLQSWHASYTHTGWGAPVALVVPPTARMQTRTGWGVSQSRMTPIYHQFERPYPAAMSTTTPGMCAPLYPTPRWPSHTDQFGVYYVRGPW